MKKKTEQAPPARGGVPIIMRRKQYGKLLGVLYRNGSSTVIVKGTPSDREITVSMGPLNTTTVTTSSRND